MAKTKTLAEALPLMAAATAMGLGYASARDRILKDEVAGYQQNGRWYVTQDSIDYWLAAKCGTHIANDTGNVTTCRH